MSLIHCRLCQLNLGTIELINENKLLDKIFECTNIQVLKENNKPQSICEKCKINIETFHTFLQLVRKVDKEINEQIVIREKKEIERKKYRKFKCTKCSRTFFTRSALKCHQESHKTNHEFIAKKNTDVLNNKGEYCNGSESQGTQQCDIKKPEKSFICQLEMCKKICTSAYTLKTHQLKHQERKPFLCAACGKGFITKNSLTCHEKIHWEVKGYKCEACNIEFSARSNLRAHEKKHHEGIRFHCSQCTKVFIAKSSLERHEKIHTGIREFQCASCPSAFYTSKELSNHTRYHLGLKQHKCDQCYKSFYEKHHLTVHLRSHSGERPYVCKIPGCSKSFTESQKLTRHLKARHPPPVN